jgi:glutamate synthase (NADPH) large chain
VLPREQQDAATFHKGQADDVWLKKLIDDHHRWTGSLRARHILDHWAESRAKFIKVFPHEYARALKQMKAATPIAPSLSKGADAAVSKAKSKNTTVSAK